MAFSLDAKRQLYDKIILVLASNSLYLNIIHEYKIYFTTVQTVHQTKFVLILGFSQTRLDTDCPHRTERSRSRLYLRLISN